MARIPRACDGDATRGSSRSHGPLAFAEFPTRQEAAPRRLQRTPAAGGRGGRLFWGAAVVAGELVHRRGEPVGVSGTGYGRRWRSKPAGGHLSCPLNGFKRRLQVPLGLLSVVLDPVWLRPLAAIGRCGTSRQRGSYPLEPNTLSARDGGMAARLALAAPDA